MNRVLSLPITRITPEQLELLKTGRHVTKVAENGTIKLRHRNGFFELKFVQTEDHLPPNTAVCVWWKGGGFVCATQAELESQAQEAQSVAQQVAQTRAMLAAARNERHARQVAKGLAPLDITQPETTSIY